MKKKIAQEIKRFKLTNSNSSENSVIRGYIETLLTIPWKKPVRIILIFKMPRMF